MNENEVFLVLNPDYLCCSPVVVCIIRPYFTAIMFDLYDEHSPNFACMKSLWLIAFCVILGWTGCMVA